MPFDGEFDDVYQIGIKESCAAAGAYCERVDEQIFEERILDRIYNQISKADVVIADMTGRNPNVFYEVGYAHALGKPTVLLTQEAEDIPFDLKHFPHIIYGNKLTQLRDDLTKRIQWHVDNPSEGREASKDILVAYMDGVPLSNQPTVHFYPNNKVPSFSITFHNVSNHTFGVGTTMVGVISTARGCRNKGSARAKLPDGRYLHTIDNLNGLFPDQYSETQVILETDKDQKTGDELEVILRVFTVHGSRDYPIILKKSDKPSEG